MYRFGIAIIFSLLILNEGRIAAQEKPKIDTTKAERSKSSPTTFSRLIGQFELRKDLELAGDQVVEIKEQLAIFELKGVEWRDIAQRYRDGKTDEEEYRKFMDDQQKALAENVGAIKNSLLPHQQKRLHQVFVQYAAVVDRREERADAGRVYLSPKFLSELKISPKQKKEFESIYGRRDEEILREYKKFNEQFKATESELYNKILEILEDDQKAEVEKHVGPPAHVFATPAQVASQLEQKQDRKK